jgi:hypothetical protein
MEEMAMEYGDEMGMGMEGQEYDQEMMDAQDMYGMEEDDGMGHHNYDNMDEEGYGEEDGESLNFEQNPEFAHMGPLDRMRKIRRFILRTVNDIRVAQGNPKLEQDIQGNKAANDYALHLLSNPEDAEKCKEFCDANLVAGDMKALCGMAFLEEEEHQVSLHEQMVDAHGLLLELQPELTVLTDPMNTHIGIGFAFTKE